MAAKISGYALAGLGAGLVLFWSGFTGKGVLATVQSVIKGTSPQGNPAVNFPVDQGATGDAGSSGSLLSSPPSDESGWIKSFLDNIGAPQSQANINSMRHWIARETPWPPAAKFNPLNATMSEPGATDYNSVGVKNYPSALVGMQATVATIENGQYSDILLALRSGTGLAGRSFAGLRTWSGGGYSSV
jgi:hypothetical protein